MRQREWPAFCRRFLLGALVGAAVFLALYGWDTLRVSYDSWIRCGYVEEDIIQHYAAWQYFRNAPWDFPLTWVSNLASPTGTAAAWGDILPWAGLFFKALSPILPATFQYFGIVSLFHFVMQGGFAWVLVGHFDKRWSVCLPGTLLFCLWPAFLERVFRHLALSAQWLVLAMLYLYFIGRQSKKLPWFGWLVIFGLVPGVHAYFLPMAFGLLCAAVLEVMVHRRRFVKPLGLVALCVAAALICARGIGVIMPNTLTGEGGFGIYSMNLNALFNPSSADFFAPEGQMDWSLALPTLGQHSHQYDGFNYLGLGVLLTLAAMAVYVVVRLCRLGLSAGLRQAGRRLYSHIGLVVAAAVFTLFALSNQVYLGQRLVFGFKLPHALDMLLSTFRASGRIFWPVGYLALLVVILFCAKRIKGRPFMAGLALLALLAVQLGDMGGLLYQKHQHFTSQTLTVDNDYESEKAAMLIGGTDTIRCLGGPLMYYPFAECLIRWNPDIQTDLVFFSKGNYGVVYLQYEHSLELLLSGAPIDENTLYVANEADYLALVFASAHPDVAAWQLEDFYLFGVATDDRPAPDFVRGG